MKTKSANIVLGTMNFGIQNGLSASENIIKYFRSYGYSEIDTAFVYNEGESEKIIGNISKKLLKNLKIATKVNPKIDGKLDRDSIFRQVEISLARMNRKYVDILYLHFPDPETPILNTLEACNDLYKKGLIRELGLSNYSAAMVEEIYNLCKMNNFILPTVYQGMYNAIARKVEEIFPLLRKLGIRFYAYNPLAGGLLSGKYLNFNDKPTEGRFQIRPNYLNRYWKKSFFNFIQEISKEIRDEELTLSEVSLKWLSNHSLIDFSKGDAIIIGVSKITHLSSNIKAIESSELSSSLIHFFDELWKTVEIDSPSYYRYYNEKI